MVEPAHRKATYDDVLGVPEHLVAEILDGELVTSPRPGGPHSVALSATGASLVPPFQFGDRGPGGWWILDEPELHFSGNVHKFRLLEINHAIELSHASALVAHRNSPLVVSSGVALQHLEKRPVGFTLLSTP